MVMLAAEVEDGSSGQQQRRRMTTAMADNNIGNGGQRQQQTMTAADNDGTQDRAVDYEGEGGEQAANNNGIRACRTESVKK
jgi:hypothetical protein